MGGGEWTQLTGDGRTHPQDSGGGRNSSQVQGRCPPARVRPESRRELQGGEGSISGCGKAQALKGESLCVCTCCLAQNVSKLVPRMPQTCPIQCLVLRYPCGRVLPPPRCPCHDSPSGINRPHAKQEVCLESWGGCPVALLFSKDNFCKGNLTVKTIPPPLVRNRNKSE